MGPAEAMVNRLRHAGSRPGTTLVEVVVALAALGGGLAAIAATATAAVRVRSVAETEAIAAAEGAWILDSLATQQRPVSGAAVRGTLRVDWIVSPAPHGHVIDVRVRDSDGRVLYHAGAIASPWPVRLSAVP